MVGFPWPKLGHKLDGITADHRSSYPLAYRNEYWKRGNYDQELGKIHVNKVGSQTNVYVSDSVLDKQSPEGRWKAQPINGEYKKGRYRLDGDS